MFTRPALPKNLDDQAAIDNYVSKWRVLTVGMYEKSAQKINLIADELSRGMPEKLKDEIRDNARFGKNEKVISLLDQQPNPDPERRAELLKLLDEAQKHGKTVKDLMSEATDLKQTVQNKKATLETFEKFSNYMTPDQKLFDAHVAAQNMETEIKSAKSAISSLKGAEKFQEVGGGHSSKLEGELNLAIIKNDAKGVREVTTNADKIRRGLEAMQMTIPSPPKPTSEPFIVGAIRVSDQPKVKDVKDLNPAEKAVYEKLEAEIKKIQGKKSYFSLPKYKKDRVDVLRAAQEYLLFEDSSKARNYLNTAIADCPEYGKKRHEIFGYNIDRLLSQTCMAKGDGDVYVNNKTGKDKIQPKPEQKLEQTSEQKQTNRFVSR